MLSKTKLIIAFSVSSSVAAGTYLIQNQEFYFGSNKDNQPIMCHKGNYGAIVCNKENDAHIIDTHERDMH